MQTLVGNDFNAPVTLELNLSEALDLLEVMQDYPYNPFISVASKLEDALGITSLISDPQMPESNL